MRRVRLLPMLPLVVVWLMLVGELTVSSVVFAVLVAWLVLWLFPMPPLFSTVRIHPVGMARLVGKFLYDLVTASAWVAWLSVRPRPIGRGALIDITLRLDDDLRRTIVAELTSLVPGTVVIELDQATSIMTMHVLDATDPHLLARERANVRALEDRVEAALSVAQHRASGGATEASITETLAARNERERT